MFGSGHTLNHNILCKYARKHENWSLNWLIYCLRGTEDMNSFIQTNTGFLGLYNTKIFYRSLNTSLEVRPFLVQISSDTVPFQKFQNSKSQQLGKTSELRTELIWWNKYFLYKDRNTFSIQPLAVLYCQRCPIFSLLKAKSLHLFIHSLTFGTHHSEL